MLAATTSRYDGKTRIWWLPHTDDAATSAFHSAAKEETPIIAVLDRQLPLLDFNCLCLGVPGVIRIVLVSKQNLKVLNVKLLCE